MPKLRGATARKAAVGRKRLAVHEGNVWQLHTFDPIDRIAIVKNGLPAEVLPIIAQDLGYSREKLYRTIGVARATVERKVRQKKPLTSDESERALGIVQLVSQVARMVAESGSLEGFDAARWVAAWLDQPLAALGGRRPGELMDTAEGRAIVSKLVAQMQSAAYA